MKSGSAHRDALYVLYNIENYYPVIHNTSQEILTKFIEVLIEYMRLISEKINIKKKQYYIFIFERGIETLIHIFSMIFYYTKNLELTFYHSQKAYYFYIEFIEQISDDNITFLQLSSRDALMFVYKKTIFELNNERKKTMPLPTADELTIISYTDAHMHIYKKLVGFILNHKDFKYENKLDYINMCCDKMYKFVSILNKHKIKKNYTECIYLFTNLLAIYGTNEKPELITVPIFFDILEDFIKKLKDQIKERITKKKISNEKIIINKIYECSINDFINENGLTLLVDHIFTE
jgi:hypothetical protein